MKRFTFFIVLFLFFSVSFAQEELIANKQFMLGCTNVGSTEVVTHYINAVGEVWELNGSSFVTGFDDAVYENSLITIGNADFSSQSNWPGFNFPWLMGDSPDWTLGLYKVTNSKQTDKYFYLDSRDSAFAAADYTPDFFIYFDNLYNRYFHRATGDSILQGEVVRVWDIHEESPYTSGLQNYWSNVLALVPSISQPYSPRIIWGPIPNFTAAGYKIYWRYGGKGNFSLLATVGANTWEYTHEGLVIGNGIIAEYKVRAFNNSSNSDYSNTVQIGTNGFYKYNFDNNITSFNYSLEQNYPNPFNPSTTIHFSVPENSFISLKVYDVLGAEVAELVSETKEPGNYSIPFNASKLTSGIYFYTLKANNYSITKKMLLAK